MAHPTVVPFDISKQLSMVKEQKQGNRPGHTNPRILRMEIGHGAYYLTQDRGENGIYEF